VRGDHASADQPHVAAALRFSARSAWAEASCASGLRRHADGPCTSFSGSPGARTSSASEERGHVDSKPRSANAVAITFAPRSCPSWPSFATRMRGRRPSSSAKVRISCCERVEVGIAACTAAAYTPQEKRERCAPARGCRPQTRSIASENLAHGRGARARTRSRAASTFALVPRAPCSKRASAALQRASSRVARICFRRAICFSRHLRVVDVEHRRPQWLREEVLVQPPTTVSSLRSMPPPGAASRPPRMPQLRMPASSPSSCRPAPRPRLSFSASRAIAAVRAST